MYVSGLQIIALNLTVVKLNCFTNKLCTCVSVYMRMCTCDSVSEFVYMC